LHIKTTMYASQFFFPFLYWAITEIYTFLETRKYSAYRPYKCPLRCTKWWRTLIKAVTYYLEEQSLQVLIYDTNNERRRNCFNVCPVRTLLGILGYKQTNILWEICQNYALVWLQTFFWLLQIFGLSFSSITLKGQLKYLRHKIFSHFVTLVDVLQSWGLLCLPLPTFVLYCKVHFK
jgi:hypothetical protein